MRRFVSLAAAAVLVGGLVGLAPAADAKASRLPVITGMSSHLGPISMHTFSVYGRNLDRAEFARYDGTIMHVRQVSSREVRVSVFSNAGKDETRHLVLYTTHGSSVMGPHDLYTTMRPPRLLRLTPDNAYEYAVASSGGTMLTVSGTDVRDVRSITFGGVRGTITGGHLNSVTVRAPKHAVGATSMVVTTAVGSDRWPVVFVGAPLITSVNPIPDLASTTRGGDVTINGLNLYAPMSVTVDGIRAKVWQSDSAGRGADIILPPHKAGPGHLRVANFAGVAQRTDADVEYLTPSADTWQPGARLDMPGAAQFVDVSCPSADFCAALAIDGAYLYDGTDWTGPHAVPDSADLSAISCSSSSFCLALGGTSAAVFDGSTWSATAAGSSHLSAVSCPADGSCVALDDNNGVVSTVEYYSGFWTHVPDAHVNAYDLTCQALDQCEAAFRGQLFRWDGDSWTSTPIADQTEYLNDIACPTADFCAAVDADGYEWTYHAAAGWARGPALGLTGTPEYVSCRAADDCVIGAQDGQVVAVEGTTVGTVLNLAEPADPGYRAVPVSCVLGGRCVAAGNFGQVAAFDGASWSAPTQVALPQGQPDSVSCTSATWCLASDSYGNSYTFDGHEWSPPTQIDPSSTRSYTLACGTPTLCVGTPAASADNSSGAIEVWSAGEWKRFVAVLPGAVGASCTADRCIAVSSSAYSLYDPSTGSWSSVLPIGTSGITAVSCVSSTDCEAAAGARQVVGFGARGWGKPLTLAGPATSAASGLQVQCSRSGTCVAVSTDKGLSSVRTAGGVWSRFEPMYANAHLSCGSDGTCVTADGYATEFVNGAWSDEANMTPEPYFGYQNVLACADVDRTFVLGLRRDGQTVIGRL